MTWNESDPEAIEPEVRPTAAAAAAAAAACRDINAAGRTSWGVVLSLRTSQRWPPEADARSLWDVNQDGCAILVVRAFKSTRTYTDGWTDGRTDRRTDE